MTVAAPAFALPTVDEIQIEMDRRAARGSFAEFVKMAWHVLEPDTPLIWNWHMDAICFHLQALVEGRFLELGLPNRLLINVPPGSSKSLLVSVFLQAWEWGPQERRSIRYLSTSYNDTPVNRDTCKCRDLILSEWYQARWPEVYLVRQAETSFANSGTGTRRGLAFGSLTSQRGDRLVIDDPHSTESAESDAERVRATKRFREGAQNRLNDQKRSCIIVIMQRLHEEDVSGVILSLGMEYMHLCLPMEYEPKRHCSTPLGFDDPRTEDGELLDPVRFPPEEVARLKRDMGSYAYAGQYQQRPAPREGGMFKRAWFAGRYIKAAPSGTRWVRHWDLAASQYSTSARTAGVKLGITPSGKFVIAHAITEMEEGDAVRRIIKGQAEMDGKDVYISLPQDPGQAGKTQYQDYVTQLAGWTVKKLMESGSKENRAEPFAAQCEAGNVFIVRGEWNETYLDEMCLFPAGKFKDQVDASSGAFAQLLELPNRASTKEVAGLT